MKVKDITLQVNGREMTEEVAKTAEVEAKAEPTKTEAIKYEVALTPTEGKCFEVNPMGIDRSLFQQKRSDERQEETRQYILEAFDEVDKYPEEYAKLFKTLIPEKTWDGYKMVKELKQYAKEIGDHMANWVELALVWAQQIANGETWEAICNNPDTVNWYRLVIWKNGHIRLVGGSRNINNISPATELYYFSDDDNFRIGHTVPLVVL